MRHILKELNDSAGLAGSMVITPDGIMVAAALEKEREEDAVAAFASSLLISLKRGLSKLRAPSSLQSCSLTGTTGRIVFINLENCYLVVVTDVDSRLDQSSKAVQRAIHDIKNRRVA
jgi:predicted regulator of Ras-like GTPase activity (Roadblock/LC7/MglB family)